VIPGQIVFSPSDASGGGQAALWIRSNRSIGIGTEFHDPVARLHIRNDTDPTLSLR